MTKKELVKLLNENFADDEEVFVRYDDDQGECVDKIREVNEVTQTFIEKHYNVLIGGKWVRWDKGMQHPSYFGYKDREWEEVIDREWQETKKCICV